MSALRLYKQFDKVALLRQLADLDADPSNLTDPALKSIHLLTPGARKKSTAITQAIAWHIEDERKAAGIPVAVAGYSGRQSNRR